LFGDSDPDYVIERATQTDLNGNLMPKFQYLSDYVNAGVITPAVRKYDPKIDKPLPNPDGIDLVAQLLQDRARI
jgi:hypothetical protein